MSGKVALQLFHGRASPDEQLEGWGSEGPVFLVDYVHMTYLCDLKLGIDHPAGDGDLHFVEDLLYYDGAYYGDWSVFPEALLKTDTVLQSRVAPFDANKAIPPKEKRT